MNKKCSKCQTVKEYSEFYKNKTEYDAHSAYCKECCKSVCKAWRDANPEKVKVFAKVARGKLTKIQRRNKYLASISTEKRVKAIGRAHRLRAYGLTEAEYQKMRRAQRYLCAICQEKRKLHVDHNHETGKVRGLLCHGCNTAIGKLGDTSAGVYRAVSYLQKQGD